MPPSGAADLRNDALPAMNHGVPQDAPDDRPGGRTAGRWMGHAWAIALLALATLAIRLPYWREAVIDWDESTFLLLGQSVLDGHLPYTELLDVKPPLLWLGYGAVIAAVGQDVPAVRLAASLWVLAAATWVYLAARRLGGPREGLVAGGLCIAGMSLLPSGQAAMSEHLAMVPAMGAALLLLGRLTPGVLFAAGAAMGAAALVRINLAYPALALGAAILLLPRGPGGPRPVPGLRDLGAYCAGGAMVLGATALPYAASGQLPLLWNATVAAPLARAAGQAGVAQVLALQAIWLGETLGAWRFPGLAGTVAAVFVGGIWGLVRGLRAHNRAGPLHRRALWILGSLALGIQVSILVGGVFNAHYPIALVPVLAIYAASLLQGPPVGRLLLAGLALAIALGTFSDYRRVALEGRGDGYPGPGNAYRVARYLGDAGASEGRMLLLSDHLAYWLLGAKPYPVATHPSNLAREHLVKTWLGPQTTLDRHLGEILDSAPDYIVGSQLHRYFIQGSPFRWCWTRQAAERAPTRLRWGCRPPWTPERARAQALLDRSLARDYRLAARIGTAQVYIRKSPPPGAGPRSPGPGLQWPSPRPR